MGMFCCMSVYTLTIVNKPRKFAYYVARRVVFGGDNYSIDLEWVHFRCNLTNQFAVWTRGGGGKQFKIASVYSERGQPFF